MTAITYADRSTHKLGVDALGPNTFEHGGEQAEQDQTLIAQEELKQIDIETQSLDGWVAFRVAPVFVDKIYLGQPLDNDAEKLAQQIITLELETQMRNYATEASDIQARQLPGAISQQKELQSSLDDYVDAIALAEAEVENQNKTGYGNLRLIMDLPKYRKSRSRLQASVNRLTTVIPGLALKTKVWKHMERQIEDLLSPGSEDALATRIHSILHIAQKSAYERVIISLKNDINSPEVRADQAVLDSKQTQLDAVTRELAAFEAIAISTSTQEAEDESVQEAVIEKQVEPAAKPARVQRVLGSFSSRAAAFSGAFFR